MLPMMHKPEFYITLDNKEVILHGFEEESSGVIVKGSLTLNCMEPTRVKQITLSFKGASKVHWTEGVGSNTKHFREEHTIIEKNWEFLKLQKKSYHLNTGKYTWKFELPLPGNLLESIHHELGCISYCFKAYCERPTFFTNLIKKKSIRVKRLILPSCVELSQPVSISRSWENKVSYDIGVPSQVFSANTNIPISFDLTPIAPQLIIRSVHCCLKEHFTFYAEGRKKTQARTIQYFRDSELSTDLESGRWSKLVLLHVPHEIVYDMSGEFIQVKHTLELTVVLENKDGHISELRASIPLILSSIAPDDNVNLLPAYEDAIRAIPYTEDQLLAAIPALSNIDSCLSPATWMNADIPSYASALQSTQIPYSSLPSYESIISVA